MRTTTLTPTGTGVIATPLPTPRGWALAGLGAGVAGIASMVGSSLSGAVYEDDIAGDAVAITERLSEMVGPILLLHTATMVSALLLLVFAAGLQRHLERHVGPESLLPRVATYGLLLVAVAQLLGSALTTEFVFAVQEPGLLVPETAAFFGHWIGTVPWLWGGAGVTGVAVGLAALWHGAAARWLGLVSIGLGGVTLVIAASPLQYLAGMSGPLWLVVVTTGLLTARTG